MRRRAPRHFLSLFSSLLCREREKSMAGHEEAIGYVCFSGETSLRLHAARLTWAPFIPPLPPRGPLNAPPTLVVSTPLLHIASDRAGISLSQQVCVVLCCVVSSREVFAAEMSHISYGLIRRLCQNNSVPKLSGGRQTAEQD